jgi:hypothetical protein
MCTDRASDYKRAGPQEILGNGNLEIEIRETGNPAQKSEKSLTPDKLKSADKCSSIQLVQRKLAIESYLLGQGHSSTIVSSSMPLHLLFARLPKPPF